MNFNESQHRYSHMIHVSSLPVCTSLLFSKCCSCDKLTVSPMLSNVIKEQESILYYCSLVFNSIDNAQNCISQQEMGVRLVLIVLTDFSWMRLSSTQPKMKAFSVSVTKSELFSITFFVLSVTLIQNQVKVNTYTETHTKTKQ